MSSRIEPQSGAPMSGHSPVLESATLRAVINPDQGADVTGLWHQPSGVQLLWRRDIEDLTDDHLQAPSWSTEHFYARYRGGLQEILPNAGLSYALDGVELGFHGEAWSARWDVDRRGSNSEKVRCSTELRRVPLRIEKTYRLGDDGAQLQISSSVTNVSDASLDFMWGFHPVFTDPLVDDSARLQFRAREVRVHPETFGSSQHFPPGAKYQEVAFKALVGGEAVTDGIPLFPGGGGTADLLYAINADGNYRIVNGRLGIALVVEWDTEHLPHLWIWQECRAQGGYPWYGRHHIVGIEPFSSYPALGLGAAIENRTNLTIGAGETVSTWVNLTVSAIADGGCR